MVRGFTFEMVRLLLVVESGLKPKKWLTPKGQISSSTNVGRAEKQEIIISKNTHMNMVATLGTTRDMD